MLLKYCLTTIFKKRERERKKREKRGERKKIGERREEREASSNRIVEKVAATES